MLEKTDNLLYLAGTGNSLILDGMKVIGVQTSFGTKFFAKAVILTNGTFLNGLMHIGFTKIKGGRSGDQASDGSK